MAWTTPRTWVSGELVTATMMNAHIRDNLAYLKASPALDGGLIVGFAGTPTDDTVAVGDANFLLDFNAGTAPRVTYDSGDFSSYNRTSNFWDWQIASTLRMKLNASGLQIADGLVVGFAGTPTAAAVEVGDANFLLDFNAGTAPRTTYDSGDFCSYTRSTNFWDWQIGSVSKFQIGGNGVKIAGGLCVGFTGTTPTASVIAAGDANFALDFNTGSDPVLRYDSGDYITYNRAGNFFTTAIGATTVTTLDAAGLRVPKGLVVGFASSPTDDTVAVGDATFLLDYNGAVPKVTFDSGDYVTYDRTNNAMQFVIGTTTWLNITSAHLDVLANLSLYSVSANFNGGTNVAYVGNRGTLPSANPTGGGYLYSDAGAGKWRGTSGTITTFGPADPHCPRCGRDCALESENPDQGWHSAICLWCLSVALERVGVNPEEYGIPPSPDQVDRITKSGNALALVSPNATLKPLVGNGAAVAVKAATAAGKVSKQ